MLPVSVRQSALRDAPSARLIKNHLRAAEERDRAAVLVSKHRGVPHVRRAPEMHGARRASDRTLACGAEKVRLELDRREVDGVLGQMRETTVAARRVGQRDDRRRMQVAIRREYLRAHGQLRLELLLADGG